MHRSGGLVQAPMKSCSHHVQGSGCIRGCWLCEPVRSSRQQAAVACLTALWPCRLQGPGPGHAQACMHGALPRSHKGQTPLQQLMILGSMDSLQTASTGARTTMLGCFSLFMMATSALKSCPCKSPPQLGCCVFTTQCASPQGWGIIRGAKHRPSIAAASAGGWMNAAEEQQEPTLASHTTLGP